ncbi:MAG TPA: hypothetical protein VG146_05065 [Verrucomicrobiae bacterium]|nr:hypothetical protein [Verrucomicrobiae bacterium]
MKTALILAWLGTLAVESGAALTNEQTASLSSQISTSTRYGLLNWLDNLDLGARCPFYQFVSESGLVDSTFGAGIEVGIPTGSALSKNAELVPKIFTDLKIGNFTTQSIFGYSTLFGPGEEGGLQTFEYGFVFGYTIARNRLPLPDVLETIPFLELIGETELNKGNPGHNSLLGNAGLRINLKAVGRVQPRPGIGFVFPMDSGAREQTGWGVITSLVFQF